MLTNFLSVFADEELLFTNFNSDPVINGPAEGAEIVLNNDDRAALITKIRTYHWNDGKGAQSGSICIAEDDQDVQCWLAIGRSDGGKTNIYWEALVEIVLNPGHIYHISVSNNSSWSYNEGSANQGFFELYGIRPVPEGYAAEEPEDNSPESDADDIFRIVTFGHFEQDGKTGNGAEDIEWYVLAEQNGMQLLISKYGLELTPYFASLADMSWESSKARQWLNDDFYNDAFSEDEKQKILPASNMNLGNKTYGISGGNPTTDLLFLMSLEEIELYFQNDSERICSMTPSAKMKGNSGKQDTVRWLLRSPGSDSSMRAFVDTDGKINNEGINCGNECDQTLLALRPAFWMNALNAVPESSSAVVNRSDNVPAVSAESEPAAVPGTSADAASYNPTGTYTGSMPSAVPGTSADTASYNPTGTYTGSMPSPVPGTSTDAASSNPTEASDGTASADTAEIKEQAVVTTVPVIAEETVAIPAVRQQPENNPPSAIRSGKGFSVTYLNNECLAQVPTDLQLHMPGETVTVLFEPVAYKDGLIFYGWDINDDGNADFGYEYYTFTMPDQDVVLKAICIAPYYGPDLSSLYASLYGLNYAAIQNLISTYYNFNY